MSRYADLVRQHLGRKQKPSDGLTEAEIRKAEVKTRRLLPTSVREYYRAAGNLAQLNKAHNILFAPDDLRECEGFLIFMEENQAVVHWGIRLSDLSDSDPEVWQRVNVTPPEWYSEGVRFSEFIARMFDWQASVEGQRPA